MLLTSLIFAMFTTSIAATNSQPSISRVYGDEFIAGVIQYQAVGITGVLDGSFGTSGSLDATNSLTNPLAQAVQVLSDGSILILLDDGTNSYIVKYTCLLPTKLQIQLTCFFTLYKTLIKLTLI